MANEIKFDPDNPLIPDEAHKAADMLNALANMDVTLTTSDGKTYSGKVLVSGGRAVLSLK